MRSAILDENNTVSNVIVGAVGDSIPCSDEVAIGWHYDGAAFTAPVVAPPPPPTTEELMRALRTRRDELLRTSDITQLVDAPLSAEQKKAWATYRQALRDLPETTDISSLTMEAVTDNTSEVWPQRP